MSDINEIKTETNKLEESKEVIKKCPCCRETRVFSESTIVCDACVFDPKN